MDRSDVALPGAAAGGAPAQIKDGGGAGQKGLKGGSLGLFSSVVIGVASTAPGYSLAATLGLVAAIEGIGNKTPAVMIISFIPMLMVAAGFYYMNRADPDCGQTFIWVTHAFGPQVGWVVGFAAVAASVIVQANLAEVAAQYTYLTFGWDHGAGSNFWLTFGGVIWLLLITWIVAVGIEISARAQYILMFFQMAIMLIFGVVAIVKVYASHPSGAVHIGLGWFVPTHMSFHQIRAGVLLGVFIYWGWDTVTSINEESEDSARLPGISALLSTIVLVVTYAFMATASQAYHGPGFLANNVDDVFSALSKEVLGSTIGRLMFISLFTSAAASALTTLLPMSRSTLSMAAHKAFPDIFARVNPKYQTPFWGTLIISAVSIVFYVAMTAISPNILYDAIDALGFMICLAYGFTGFAAAIYYRKELVKSVKNFLLMGLVPAVGGIILMVVFAWSIQDYLKPDSGYYTKGFFGIGDTIVLGIGTILLGVVLMFVAWVFKKDFFRRRPITYDPANLPMDTVKDF